MDTTTADLARMERNLALAASDWTMTNDAPTDKYAWAEYRQQLRDLPADPNWPDMEWPRPPA